MPRVTPEELPFDPALPHNRPIEGDFIVGHSELKAYRGCPLKHFWSYVEGWHKPLIEGAKIPATHKGTQWHAIMNDLYAHLLSNQGDWDGAAEAAWDAAEPIIETIRKHEEKYPPPKKETSWADTLDWMLEGYLDNYRWHATRFKVVAIESTRYARLPNLDGTPSDIMLRFTPDVVFWDLEREQHCCVDHKSTGTNLKQVDVDMDDQFGLYPWALTRNGLNVRQFYCSQAHTKMLKRHMTVEERFAWLPSYRSLAEQHTVAFDAVKTAIDVRRVYETREVPWPAPDSTQCKRFCDFLEPHIMIRRDARKDAAERNLRAFGFETGGNDYQRGNAEKDEAARALA